MRTFLACIKHALVVACDQIEQVSMPHMDEKSVQVANEMVLERIVELPVLHVKEDLVELMPRVPRVFLQATEKWIGDVPAPLAMMEIRVEITHFLQGRFPRPQENRL